MPVIVAVLPPTTVDADSVTLESAAEVAVVIVKDAVADVAPRVDVITELVFAVTAMVVTVNVAVLAPAATVTEAGTLALVMLDLSATTSPPVGATPFRVTVPVEGVPPTTEIGDRETLLRVGAVMARLAVAEVDPRVAVIVADVAAETAAVVTVNVAVVAPAATVTEVGTVALALLDLSDTTVPPVGATADSVTVPVLVAPPATEVGFTVTEESFDATVTARDAV